MARDERGAAADLTRLDAFAANPGAYHIFLALRVIEASYQDRPRLGRSRRPAEDPVRLSQAPELAYPPETISAFRPGARPGEAGEAARLTQLAFGLFGPHGPLPLHLTEYARDRMRNHRDGTFAAFADIFHHRMASLFYRAWAAGEPAPSFDRPDDDPFAEKVAAISGHRGAGFDDRDAMPDVAKRHFAGLLGQGQRHMEGLRSILSGLLRAPVEIAPFIGSWLHLEPHDRWRLGAAARGGGLGRTTSLGARVWSRGAKFRIRIGPLGLDDFRRMLPGGPALARLTAAVRNYAGDAHDWDVNLVLREGEVPETRLGAAGSLGHDTWVGVRPKGRDADELHLAPLAALAA